MHESTYPPLSQISQGASWFSSAAAVKDPFVFSNPQKNKVSFECPGRFTGRFPAKLRGRVSVTLGSASTTWKSVKVRMLVNKRNPSQTVQTHSPAIRVQNQPSGCPCNCAGTYLESSRAAQFQGWVNPAEKAGEA